MSWYSAANSEQSIFWDMLFQAESPTTQIYCILCLHLPSDISALLMFMPAVVNTWCCCLHMNRPVKNHISNRFCFKLFRAKCLMRRHGVVVKPISAEQEVSGFESRLESLCARPSFLTWSLCTGSVNKWSVVILNGLICLYGLILPQCWSVHTVPNISHYSWDRSCLIKMTW